MKILYVDITSPIGHINYNIRMLELLREENAIDVAFKKDYLPKSKIEELGVNMVYEIPTEFFSEYLAEKNSSKFLYKVQYRINFYKSMKMINKFIREGSYDLVFFSSIEVVSFCLSTLGKLETRYVFVDHAIADIDKNKIKRFFWKHINKNIEAVVMEKYICDFLKDRIGIKNQIWILKHPLLKIYDEKLKSSKVSKKIIFAPSGSNDEKFISFLIDNNDKIKNFTIIIKSKKNNFKNENLKVINTRLSDEEYYKYMNDAEYILMPYTNEYNYRTSGVFFEAVEMGKRCIINSNNTLTYYSEKYPNVVMLFHGYDDFLKFLTKNTDSIKKEELNQELMILKDDYSDEKLKKDIEKLTACSSNN